MKINNAYVLHYPIYAPSIPEQKRIASFFTVLDKKIAQLREKKTLLEEYKKGVMQKLFAAPHCPNHGLDGLKNFTNDEAGQKSVSSGNPCCLRFRQDNGKEYPKWEKRKLGELLEFKNGINASKEQYGSGYKFINVLDILNNNFITNDKIIGKVDISETVFTKYSVKYGDVLFQRSSETREEVGIANVYLDKDKSATFGGFVIRGRKIGEYEPTFFNSLLKTDLAREQITSKSGGSTRYNVGQDVLSSVILNFPSLPEQTKIANFLSSIDDKNKRADQKQLSLTF